jgi:flagellar hook-associated protein 1 FlgK
MVSTFFGFNISLKALMAAQKGLEITAHNIANANTPGYTRQRADFVASNPIVYPGMTRPGGIPLQIGTGVNVRSIERIRNSYLDQLIRRSGGDGGKFGAREAGFSRLEVVLNEPNGNGISSVVTEFFNAFADLSNSPELTSERANVMEKGSNLAETFNQLDSELKSMRDDENNSIRMTVEEINKTFAQIADLNTQISIIEGTGDNANDLKDALDLLVDRLSGLVNMNAQENEFGDVTITIGGITVVDKGNVLELETRVKSGGDSGDIDVFFENGLKPAIISGELRGYIEMRDETIPEYENKLNKFASAIINRVNYQHRKGYGLDGKKSRPFFADYKVASMTGTTTLPPGTSLDTTLDELGITQGKFIIQGAEIEITRADIEPGKAITVEDLLERINSSQSLVRAELVEDFSGIRLELGLYNPPDADTTIEIFGGSTNFLSTVTGVTSAQIQETENARIYTNAMDMFNVSLAALNNLNIIAAAGENDFGDFAGVGDNTNSLAIAEINDLINLVDGASFTDYYNGVIGILGSQAQTNDRLVSNQALLLQQLDSQKAEISSVSIDEETINMIQYQRAFEGAARVSATLDSMIETIIFNLSAG